MTKDKYFEAICVLSELLLEAKNDNEFRRLLLDDRDKEIERLKTKLQYIEQYTEENKQ